MSIHKVSSRLSVFHSEYPQRFLAATRDLCSLCWSVPSRKMSVRVVQIHISQDWRSFRILSSQKSLLASHEQHGFLFFQPFTAIGHPILFPSLVNTVKQDLSPVLHLLDGFSPYLYHQSYVFASFSWPISFVYIFSLVVLFHYQRAKFMKYLKLHLTLP